MRRRLATAGAALLLAGLGACATTQKPSFYWGGYERALYVYARKPEQREAYRQTLEKAIDHGRANNTVAPGLLAELGYLYLEDGDTLKAVSLFQEEETRFPESKKFLAGVIERVNATAPAPRKNEGAEK